MALATKKRIAATWIYPSNIDTSTLTVDGKILRVAQVGYTKPSLVIGGSDTNKFVPNLNASYQFDSGSEKFWWNLNATGITVASEQPTIVVLGKRISIRVGDIEEQYQLEGTENDEVTKWLRTFYTHPGTNVFEHTITFADGVDFCYQPELTSEQIARGVTRPAEVVGSYAIYCNSSGHYKDADRETVVNYKCGKMGHIYPPWFTDADGVKQRGVLYIDKQTGLYRVTIDATWFINAHFPVTMNDTFGWTGEGGSIDWNGANPNTWYGQLDAVAPAGTLTNLTWYIYAEAGHTVRYAFYSQTGSDPDARVARDTDAFTPGEGGAITNPVAWSYALTPGAQYWGAYVAVTGGQGVYFDTAGSQVLSYNDGADSPDPAVQIGDVDAACHPSVYGTYTPGGGGSAYTVACSDGIVFDDTGRKIATLNVSAADGLSLGDGGKGPASFLAAGADSIALNDLASMLRAFSMAASDGVAFAEAAGRLAIFSRAASDGVVFGESAGAFAAYLAAAADGIAFGDETFYTVLGAIEVFAADGIALGDSALASASFQVTAAESITLGDSASRTFTVVRIAEDGIALGDAVSVQVALDAKAADGIALQDAAQALVAYLAAATDGIALQDVSINITGNLATGILSVTFSTKKSTVTLTGKKSLVTMLGKKSDVSMN